MQRLFTIEMRVDYADSDKNAVMCKAVQAAARHILATAVLLADGVKPQIVLFHDDYFSGHEEISLLEDTLGKAIAEDKDTTSEDAVSEDLMAAMREMQQDKDKANG